ncbi:MAG: hypothetical protein AB9869_01980 [Verrucomicrobiia bacterium]
MAVFGDYETIGRAWFMSGRGGRIRSSWRATNRVLGDGTVYFIKSIALPARGSSQEGTAQELPVADPGPDLVESATRLQEAYRAYPDLFAPIHAFGRTDSEVWYATDLFPRYSLAELALADAKIDSRALEHIVYCVAVGCLALQRASGRSHGNIKTGNVLLAGEPGPLRQTRLRLIDPAGLPSSKDPKGPPAANVRDATELRDLRGIGNIILELVERRPIDGPGDYTLPIEDSLAWRGLGKNAQRWLDLCNRLLDPGLSVNDISLDALAKDLSPRSHQTPMLFAGLALVAVVAIASYALWAQPLKEATRFWARGTGSLAPSEPPAPGVTDSSVAVAERSRPAQPSFRRNTEDEAAPSETDKPKFFDSAADTPPTAQSDAFVPASTDADVDPIDLPAQAISPVPVETPSPSPTIDPADSSLATQAADSGVPAGSSSGSTDSNPEGINSTKDTEPGIQTSISYPKPAPSGKPPTSSNPQKSASGRRNTDSAAQTARAGPKPTRALPGPFPGRERVPVQQTGQRERMVNRARPTRPAEQPAKASRNQVEVARAGTGEGRTRAKGEGPKQPPSTNIANLNEQLRALEVEVGRAVAVRRNSELFARVEALEARFARANQLSDKTKRRFDLLRLNLAKKLPGSAPERSPFETVIPPVTGR